MQNTVLPETISRKKAGQMSELSPGTLRRYERRGLLPAIKLNSKVTRYNVADVRKLLKRAGGEMPPEAPATLPPPPRAKVLRQSSVTA